MRSRLQKIQAKSQPTRMPIWLRVAYCCGVALICFALGYSLSYLTAIEQFIVESMNQHVSFLQSSTLLQNQTNILLLGSDNDQKFTGNPLTQTMLLVHIDFMKKELTMFSIPRDLWVRMPDRQTYGKIDQAAEYEGIPSAIKVVEQTFGIQIDHYAWVGLYGFIKSIDAIGGVNLDVLHPVLDNAYPTDINSPNPYGIQRLDIQPGLQHMTGEQALQYVRSRHEDILGDFGRTQRQRQLIVGIRDQLLHSNNALATLPTVMNGLKGQIKTDITPIYAVQLGYFFLTNKNALIEKQVTLTPPTYTSNGFSTDGQSIVVGNATNSSQLIQSIFGDTAGETTLRNLSHTEGIK